MQIVLLSFMERGGSEWIDSGTIVWMLQQQGHVVHRADVRANDGVPPLNLINPTRVDLTVVIAHGTLNDGVLLLNTGVQGGQSIQAVGATYARYLRSHKFLLVCFAAHRRAVAALNRPYEGFEPIPDSVLIASNNEVYPEVAASLLDFTLRGLGADRRPTGVEVTRAFDKAKDELLGPFPEWSVDRAPV